MPVHRSRQSSGQCLTGPWAKLQQVENREPPLAAKWCLTRCFSFRMSDHPSLMRYLSEYSGVSGLAAARKATASVLLAGLLALLQAIPALAGTEFTPSSVAKGVLLVASPMLNDTNFHQTVVLVLEHGSEGTLGLILNRATNVLLSEALPEVTVLKGTSYRLFTGGPVEPTRLLLLSRLKEPPAGARQVFDEVYVGGTPAVLERIITQARPNESFRAFAGSAGWAPGQLAFEMLQGAWATLPPGSFDIFERDPATLWQDCLDRLQAPRVISY